MKKIVEDRKIYLDDLRQLCISKEWYTRGNNEEYSNLFKRLKAEKVNYKNLSTRDLYEIAEDIKEHSRTQHEVTDIMYELNQIACTTFEAE